MENHREMQKEPHVVCCSLALRKLLYRGPAVWGSVREPGKLNYVRIVKHTNEEASTQNKVYYLSTLVIAITLLYHLLQRWRCCFDLPSDVILAVRMFHAAWQTPIG